MIDAADIGLLAAAVRVKTALQTAEALHRRHLAAELDEKWRVALDQLMLSIRLSAPNLTVSGASTCARAGSAWDDISWEMCDACVGSEHAAGLVRIGTYQWENPLCVDHPWSSPALIPLIGCGNVVIEGEPSDEISRGQLLCMIALRALAALPAGQLRLVLLDGAGVGRAFKPLTHLDNSLRGDRVITASEELLRRLRELRDDMTRIETSVLRNTYASVREYNAASPAAPEPYRLVVVSGFPHGFEPAALAELTKIATAGPGVGVHVLLDWRPVAVQPLHADMSPLRAGSAILVETAAGIRLLAPTMPDGASLVIDPPPSARVVQALSESVNEAAAQARRVVVGVDQLHPRRATWLYGRGSRTDSDIEIPIGRQGPRDIQTLRLGETAGAHHALVAGVTGRGKSVLLHAIICGAALRYSPQELRFDLIDFKGGVEFQAYRRLPHARVLAIQSEREFGLSVLRSANDEIGQREALFRRAGVSSIAGYRQRTGESIPRILVVVDEFQKFFEAPDRLADTARLLLDDIARRGRSQGIHLILASQSLSGIDVRPSTFAQIQVRIGLQLAVQDAERVFACNNLAATHLERAGQAIYNAAGGAVGGNVEFQVVYVDNATATSIVEGMAAESDEYPPPLIFDGNRPASLASNTAICRDGHEPQITPLTVYFGEPTILQEGHVSAALYRRARNNLLVCGGHPDQGVASALLALASAVLRAPPGAVMVHIADSVPADSSARPILDALSAALPNSLRARRVPEIDALLQGLAREVEARTTRQESGVSLAAEDTRLLALPASQQLRILEPDGYKASPAAENLLRILRQGPDVGVHVIGVAQPLDALLALMGNQQGAVLAHFGLRLVLDDPSVRRLLPGAIGTGPLREGFGVVNRVDQPDVLEKVRLYDPTDITFAVELLGAFSTRQG